MDEEAKREDKEKSRWEDEELYYRILNGDEEASEALIRKYRYRLIGFCIQEFNFPLEIAEDTVQECFCSFFVKVKSSSSPLKTPRALKEFFYTSVRRIAFRKKRKTKIEDLYDDLYDKLFRDIPPEEFDRIQDKETILEIKKIIDTLPEKKKRASILRFIYKLPYKEISEKLGVPEGDIRRWIHEIRESLRAWRRKFYI